MHVALDGRVIDDHFPGIGRYAFELARALPRVAPGDRFTLLVDQGRQDTRFDLSALDEAGVRVVALDAPVFAARSQVRLRRWLRASDADLFHATYWVTPYLPGRPTVLSIYDLISLAPGRLPPLRRMGLRAALWLARRSAREVVTLSAHAADEIALRFRVPPGRIHVTPLAADPRFRPASPAALRRLREEIDLPARFVLYVGSDKPHKDLQTLLAAFEAAARGGARAYEAAPARYVAGATGPLGAGSGDDTGFGTGFGTGIGLVLAGPRDPRHATLDEQIARARAGGLDVRHLGPAPEDLLPALYTAAELFAFPSLSEGFGLPPLEAMACGTPVLACDASSLPEVVGDAGRLLPPGDVAAWSASLSQLLGAREAREEMAQRGLRRAAGFTWGRTARRTVAAYRAALAFEEGTA